MRGDVSIFIVGCGYSVGTFCVFRIAVADTGVGDLQIFRFRKADGGWGAPFGKSDGRLQFYTDGA